MVRAEEERRVKSDKNKEDSDVRVRGSKNAGGDDEGEEQTVLKEEGDGKLPACGFSRDKHGDQT